MRITNFEDLEIWKSSLLIIRIVYDLSANGRFGKDFVLRDQVRRAAISVSSNIVEGFEKNNNNELIRFLKIAKGSSGEVRAQPLIANAVGYITNEELQNTSKAVIDLSTQIGKFISYLEVKRKNKEFQLVNK